MIPFNLLLLPLLGGFLFISHWKRTSPLVSRSERTRLIFYAAIVAVISAFLSRLLIEAILLSEFGRVLAAVWKLFAPFDYSGTAATSLLLPTFGFMAANWLDRKSELAILTDHIKQYGDGLEAFLLEASQRAESGQNSLVMLSCDDDKVYVGWVKRLARDPRDQDAYLRLLPLISGYRRKDDRAVEFTSYYNQAIQRLAQSGAPEISYANFIKILPLARINSLGYFDPDAYLAFQPNAQETEGFEQRDGVGASTAPAL